MPAQFLNFLGALNIGTAPAADANTITSCTMPLFKGGGYSVINVDPIGNIVDYLGIYVVKHPFDLINYAQYGGKIWKLQSAFNGVATLDLSTGGLTQLDYTTGANNFSMTATGIGTSASFQVFPGSVVQYLTDFYMGFFYGESDPTIPGSGDSCSSSDFTSPPVGSLDFLGYTIPLFGTGGPYFPSVSIDTPW